MTEQNMEMAREAERKLEAVEFRRELRALIDRLVIPTSIFSYSGIIGVLIDEKERLDEVCEKFPDDAEDVEEGWPPANEVEATEQDAELKGDAAIASIARSLACALMAKAAGNENSEELAALEAELCAAYRDDVIATLRVPRKED
jgi:hypothetical protein